MNRLFLVFFLILAFTLKNASSPSGERDSISTGDSESNVIHPGTDSTKFPPSHVLQTALAGYELLLGKQVIKRAEVLTIIDYSLPSDRERLWVLDIISKEVLYCCLVSHGRNSGELRAESFSNTPGSNASSPGFYSTGETYFGKHGLSLALDGLETDINDNARARTIVVHGADYVSSDFIRRYGRLGRSQGCPAVPVDLSNDIINTIKDGSCLFIYAPIADYTSKSPIINEINSIRRIEPLKRPVFYLKPPSLYHLSDKHLSGIVSGLSHQSML